jgi:hypothetical protein
MKNESMYFDIPKHNEYLFVIRENISISHPVYRMIF